MPQNKPRKRPVWQAIQPLEKHIPYLIEKGIIDHRTMTTFCSQLNQKTYLVNGGPPHEQTQISAKDYKKFKVIREIRGTAAQAFEQDFWKYYQPNEE